MKIYSVNSAASLYKRNNQNLSDKQCPKPCFQGNSIQTTRLKKSVPLLVGLAMGIAALLSGCYKQQIVNASASANATVSFNPNNVQPLDTVHVTDTIYIHDTINPGPGPNPDTLKPKKPSDMYDLEHWALGIDTTGFANGVDEAFYLFEEKYSNEYNKNNSKPDTVHYDGVITETFGNMDTKGTYTMKRYGAKYDGKDIIVEERNYTSGGDTGLPKAKTIYIIPRNGQNAGVDYYYYDENNQQIGYRWRMPQSNGVIYDYWGDPSNPSDQDMEITTRTVPWSQVDPIDAGKGKNK